MKAKLGKLSLINRTKYTSYKAILKKKMIQVLKDPNSNGICDYMLISGVHLPWGGENSTEDQPLLYLGQTNTWEKEVKASRAMDLEAYSYGTCKLVKVGLDIQISLCPTKGKLTQNTFFKPVKKIFKKFKPKTFLEVVSDLSEVESSTSDVSLLEEEALGNDVLLTIGPELEKYHLAINKMKKAIAKNKSEEEKKSLKVKQSKVLKQLKHLCATWAEEIVPQSQELIVDEQLERWQKIYQKWSQFFEE